MIRGLLQKSEKLCFQMLRVTFSNFVTGFAASGLSKSIFLRLLRLFQKTLSSKSCRIGKRQDGSFLSMANTLIWRFHCQSGMMAVLMKTLH